MGVLGGVAKERGCWPQLGSRVWRPSSLLAPLAGEAAPTPAPQKLPLLLEGGALSGEHPLTREVVLPTPGVWYLWLRARATGQTPALLSWDLDGRQPLLSCTAPGLPLLHH